mmetsp:Transcript_20593/g.60825  ORF Transcript_20593/g.60825 Transcript_20593/m.60825 type:complete len:313 (+) Transcript_20593:64-1002(+)
MGQQGSVALEPQRSPFDDPEPAPLASMPPVAQVPQRVTLIPTVLQWSHGGRNVYVTGTFNNWAERIPMRHSRNDFTVCLNLPVGTFSYKFIVDNEWRFSPSQPLVQDAQGNVNNCITVLDEEDFMSETAPMGMHGAEHYRSEELDFGQTWTEEALQVAKDPPPLPSQLTRVVLNSKGHVLPPTLAEEFPPPLPCTLLHMCWQQTSGNRHSAADAVVVATSRRYRTKFVSLVLYKPGRLREQSRQHHPGDHAHAPGVPAPVPGMPAAALAPFGPGQGREGLISAAAVTPRPPSLMQIDDEAGVASGMQGHLGY